MTKKRQAILDALNKLKEAAQSGSNIFDKSEQNSTLEIDPKLQWPQSMADNASSIPQSIKINDPEKVLDEIRKQQSHSSAKKTTASKSSAESQENINANQENSQQAVDATKGNLPKKSKEYTDAWNHVIDSFDDLSDTDLINLRNDIRNKKITQLN